MQYSWFISKDKADIRISQDMVSRKTLYAWITLFNFKILHSFYTVVCMINLSIGELILSVYRCYTFTLYDVLYTILLNKKNLDRYVVFIVSPILFLLKWMHHVLYKYQSADHMLIMTYFDRSESVCLVSVWISITYLFS